LESCGYAYNNYASDGSVAASDLNFDLQNSLTYGGGTMGKHTITMESIEANEQMQYFEYIPWRGRTSPFWDNRYLYWDPNDYNSPQNLGANVEDSLYFGGRGVGLWSLCQYKDEKGYGQSFQGNKGTALVRGIEVAESAGDASPQSFVYSDCSDQTVMSDRLYKHAIFCNGQANDNDGCDRVNAYPNVVNPGLSKNYFPGNRLQAFYCYGFDHNKGEGGQESCGLLTDDANDLPICDIDGNRCDTFVPGTDYSGMCRYMCEGFCYWPGSNVENPFTERVSTVEEFETIEPSKDAPYRQCVNIASSEVAWESLKHAQGAFFGSIVVGQIAGLLVCKTRWLSIRTQGMRNNVMLFGIGSEILLVTCLAYFTPINKALGTRNIRLVHWFCAIPFAILIFLFDECRKALMRATSPEKKDPVTGQVTRDAGWIERNCAY